MTAAQRRQTTHVMVLRQGHKRNKKNQPHDKEITQAAHNKANDTPPPPDRLGLVVLGFGGRFGNPPQRFNCLVNIHG